MTHHILLHLIHPGSLSRHHKRDGREHIQCHLDTVWNLGDTSGRLLELLAELRSYSQPHLSHRGSDSDHHKPGSLRYSVDGLCSGSRLDGNYGKQIKLQVPGHFKIFFFLK